MPPEIQFLITDGQSRTSWKVCFLFNFRHCFWPAQVRANLANLLPPVIHSYHFKIWILFHKSMEVCREKAMEHLKAAGEEPKSTEGDFIEEGDKDNEGESAGTTSPAHKIFEEALYGWAKFLKDSGKPFCIGDDKCQFLVVSVMYYKSTRLKCKCHVIYHNIPLMFILSWSFPRVNNKIYFFQKLYEVGSHFNLQISCQINYHCLTLIT